MAYQYWHTFDFPEFKTQGLDNSPEKLKFIKIPENLKGWSVLDVGAWDGYFSFIAEQRGAEKVISFDSPLHSWNKSSITIQSKEITQDGKEGFETAKKVLKSKVQDVEGELEGEDRKIIEFQPFDLVLDLGILYHTKDPYQHIRDLFKITNKLLILETHVDCLELPYPAMRFYPNGEINNDLGTLWGPNIFCVQDMLKRAGFTNVKYEYQNGRVVFWAEKPSEIGANKK